MDNLKEKQIEVPEEKAGETILPFEKMGEYFIETLDVKRKPMYSFIKRGFDIVSSGIGMVVLALPMLAIAIAVKTTSKGTVFYTQDRLGLNGKVIKVIKFRSMKMNAEADGAQWSKGDDDPRITKIGSVLRKTRLDELPQLWCIFKGDLSVVGPRPERECFYKEFETYIHGFSERLKVKPGLTGLAQVNGGYDLKPEEKIVYDVEYIKTRSLLKDLKIIFKTVAVVFSHDGAK
ncbi:MAG: sugar transferase [Clostridia bacterium]|nr:sugar transferase [Clostridia bacterium]